METIRLPKLDKTVLSIGSLADNSEDKQYWFTKSPYERLEAVEIMRQIVYGYDPITTRLQRVFEITQRV